MTGLHAEQRGRELEALMVSLSSKGDLPTASSSKDASNDSNSQKGIALLASLLDMSMLKFQDRDRLVDAFKSYRRCVVPGSL